MTNADGSTDVDFYLGDTGAMFGHSPENTVKVVEDRSRRGITTIMSHAEALKVAGNLRERYDLS